MINQLLIRRLAVGTFFFAFLVLGLVCSSLIPVELSPRIELPQLTLTVYWPRTSALTIEAHITTSLEAELQGLQGVVETYSTTSEGWCLLTAEFAEDTDIQLAELRLREKIYRLHKEWPKEVSWPTVQRTIPQEMRQLEDFMSFVLVGDRSVAELQKFAEDELHTPLASVPGVKGVEIWGGEEQFVEVEIDPQAVAGLEMPESILGNLEWSSYQRHLLGSMWEHGVLRRLRLEAGFSEFEEIREIPIAQTADDRILRLKDIATVHLFTKEPQHIVRVNGRNVVALSLSKEHGMDLLETAQQVDKKVALLKKGMPKGIEIFKDYDNSRGFQEQIQRITKRTFFAILFIALVVVVVFRSLQAVFIILSSIAFSILGATILFYLLGYSLNILILAGFTVGFGILVDNAVVVYDHIHRRITQLEPGDICPTALKEAIISGVRQMVQPLLASNLTTLGAFLPVFFLSSELQLYFKPFAISLGSTLCVSLFISFTLIPTFVYHVWAHRGRGVVWKFSGRPDQKDGGQGCRGAWDSFSGFLRRGYGSLLSFCIKHKKWVVAALLWMIGVPLWLLPQNISIQTESVIQRKENILVKTRAAYNAFLRQNRHKLESGTSPWAAELMEDATFLISEGLSFLEESYNAIWNNDFFSFVKPFLIKSVGGSTYLFFNKVYAGNWKGSDYQFIEGTSIIIDIEMPNNIHIEKVDQICLYFEEKILPYEEFVKKISTQVDKERAHIRIDFKEEHKNSLTSIQLYRHLISYGRSIGGITLKIMGKGLPFEDVLEGNYTNSAIKVMGFNFDKVNTVAKEIAQRLAGYKRVKDIDSNRATRWETNQYEVVARVERTSLISHEVDHGRVVQEIQARIGNTSSSIVQVDGEFIPALVRFSSADHMTIRELNQVLMRREGHSHITRIGHLTRIDTQRVLPKIRRENQSYVRLVNYSFRGPISYGANLQKKIIADTDLPYGYSLTPDQSWDGELYKSEKKELIWVILLGVVLVWMITAALFESWTKPFLVLLALPLAMIGAFYSFYLFDAYFNKGGYAAILFLVGIVVNNSILLVDHIANALKSQTGSREEIIINAAFQRIRPVFITTATTFVGLLPLLLYESRLSLWYSLSVGACGGLVSSFVLTLIIVPFCFLVREKAPTSPVN